MLTPRAMRDPFETENEALMMLRLPRHAQVNLPHDHRAQPTLTKHEPGNKLNKINNFLI